jgi:DNA polymerase-1
MKTYVLIDGNAIMHRAFHAIPSTLTAQDGTPTNAIYGFFTMLYKVTQDYQPDFVTVCFDTPVPSFRKKLLKEYQAHRPKAPDEFKQQVPIILSLLDDAGIDRVQKEGYEADDLIGSLAHAINNDLQTLILTGDKDILQLVNDHTHVISPRTGISKIIRYDDQMVLDKMGVPPARIPDFKALAGDPSDNYHAAKGIGPKTAVQLVSQFGTVEDMYAHIDHVQKDRIRNILIEHKEDVLLLKKIATIVTDLEVPLDLEKESFSGFHENLKDRLEDLQLNSLIKRFFPQTQPTGEKKKVTEKNEPQDQNQPTLF